MEKVAGVDLQDLVQKHIYTPFDAMGRMCYLLRHPDMVARRLDMSAQAPDTGKAKFVDMHYFHEDSVDCMDRTEASMSPKDYIRVLHSILLRGDRPLR